MGEIYVPRDQRIAITKIDDSSLNRLIEQAILEERLGDLHTLHLADCGSYIATQLRYFERALTRHREAKTSRKRDETESSLRRAAYDLSSAVRAMKSRVGIEQKEEQFFYVESELNLGLHFGKNLTTRVTYRWRQTIDDEWKSGDITFAHNVEPRPDYMTPRPKRKPSAAKQKQELENMLHEIWEDLTRSALYSVRSYFRDGGDGSKIPETFKVTVDPHSGGLNNYSTQFWRSQQP